MPRKTGSGFCNIEQFRRVEFINIYKKAIKLLTLSASVIIMVVGQSMRVSIPF